MYVAPRVLGVPGVPGVPGVRNLNVTPLQFEPVGLAYVRSEFWRARVMQPHMCVPGMGYIVCHRGCLGSVFRISLSHGFTF